MKNEVMLDFAIEDFDDISHEEITQKLGINPIKIYIKGEKKNPKFSGLSKRNRWIMGPSIERYSPFEEQLNALLDIIESKIDLFRPLCKKYHCEFICAIFLRFDNGEITPWVHLNSRYNKLVNELNIEFDVDLYCLPNSED